MIMVFEYYETKYVKNIQIQTISDFDGLWIVTGLIGKKVNQQIGPGGVRAHKRCACVGTHSGH